MNDSMAGDDMTLNNIHGNPILSKAIQKDLTIMTQRLEVDGLTIVVVVTKVNDLLDVMFIQIWKENFRIETFLIIHKNV